MFLCVVEEEDILNSLFNGHQTDFNQKEAAFRRKKKTPTPHLVRDFSEKRRLFKSMSGRKFSEYLERLVSDFKDNPKRFWSYVKCLKASRKLAPVVLVHENVSATTNLQRADC